MGTNITQFVVVQQGIMWGIDLVEGKDHPGQSQYDDLGMTVGLLLQLLAPIFFSRDLLLFLTVAFVC